MSTMTRHNSTIQRRQFLSFFFCFFYDQTTATNDTQPVIQSISQLAGQLVSHYMGKSRLACQSVSQPFGQNVSRQAMSHSVSQSVSDAYSVSKSIIQSACELVIHQVNQSEIDSHLERLVLTI